MPPLSLLFGYGLWRALVYVKEFRLELLSLCLACLYIVYVAMDQVTPWASSWDFFLHSKSFGYIAMYDSRLSAFSHVPCILIAFYIKQQCKSDNMFTEVFCYTDLMSMCVGHMHDTNSEIIVSQGKEIALHYPGAGKGHDAGIISVIYVGNIGIVWGVLSWLRGVSSIFPRWLCMRPWIFH